jgi:hypothetical protein
LYNDHGHPEYSTPECNDLRSLVAHDKAGERIILECARARAAAIGKTVDIFKNNTDFHGASYGTHESYLVKRSVPWSEVVHNLAPFLATRIIYAGAGKVAAKSAASLQIPSFRSAPTFSWCCKALIRCTTARLSTRATKRTAIRVVSSFARHRGRRQHERVRDGVTRRCDESLWRRLSNRAGRHRLS